MALLKVLLDIYAAINRQQVTLLGLLDLSAAFDCVDHAKYGIDGSALNWMSFLLGCIQQVYHRGRLSAVLQLLFGVPQGSILGPIPFLVYMSELIAVVANCGFSAHSYADDAQFYVCIPASDHTDAIV